MSAAEVGTVVVVEDDHNIADLLDLYLRQAGYRVLQAADGERALDLVEQHLAASTVVARSPAKDPRRL